MSVHAGREKIALPILSLRSDVLHRQAKTLVAWGLLAVLITLGSILSSTFRSEPVLLETLKGSTFVAVASAAQFFVVVSGGIDLSIASTATVSGMAAAVIMNGQDGNLRCFRRRSDLGVGEGADFGCVGRVRGHDISLK